MPYVLTTPPAVEPVSLVEAKAHLRVDATDLESDALITSLIAAARQYVERETNRSLVTQTWRLDLDDFPRGPIVLGHGPISAIGEFTYRDFADDEQTMVADTDYQVDGLPADRPRLVPAWAELVWPAAQRQPAAVSVTFTAGYGLAVSVPEALKLAILMVLANWFANRESTVAGDLAAAPMGAQHLIHSYRIPLLA